MWPWYTNTNPYRNTASCKAGEGTVPPFSQIRLYLHLSLPACVSSVAGHALDDYGMDLITVYSIVKIIK